MPPSRARSSSRRERRRRSWGLVGRERERRLPAAPRRRRRRAAAAARRARHGSPGDLAGVRAGSLRVPIEEDASRPSTGRRRPRSSSSRAPTARRVARRGGGGARRARRRRLVARRTSARITWLESDIDRDGGKLYLVAGAPASGGDDEERMLRALRSIVDAGAGPPIAVGVNRGPVLAGPIGSPTRTHLRRDGRHRQPRRAPRRARVDRARSSRPARCSSARARSSRRRARQFLMKGKAKPVTGYAVGADRRRTPSRRLRPLLPLVGRRELELAMLRGGARRRADAPEPGGRDRRRAGRRQVAPRRGAGRRARSASRFCARAASRTRPRRRSAPLRALLRPADRRPPRRAAGELPARSSTAFAQAVMPDLAQWLPLLALPFDAEVAADARGRRDRPGVPARSPARRARPVPGAHAADADGDARRGRALAGRRVAARAGEARSARAAAVARRRHPPARRAAARLGRRRRARSSSRSAPTRRGRSRSPPRATLTLSDASSSRRSPTGRRATRSSSASSRSSPADDDALPETVESLLTIRIDTLASGRPPAAPPRVGDRRATFELDLLAEILPDEVGRPGAVGHGSPISSTGPGRALLQLPPRSRAHMPPTTASRTRDGARSTLRVGEALERRSPEARPGRRRPLAPLPRSGPVREGVAYAVHCRRRRALEVRERRRRRPSTSASLAAAETVRRRRTTELARVCEALGDVRELAARYDDADAAYVRGARARRRRGPAAAQARRRRRAARALRRRARAVRAGGRGRGRSRGGRAGARPRDRPLPAGEDRRMRDVRRTRGRGRYCARRPGDARRCVLRARCGRRRPRRAGTRVSRARARDLRRARACCTGRRPCSTTWGSVRTTKAPGTTRSTLYHRSEEAVRRAGDVLTGGHATNNRAEILLDQGRLDEAAELFGIALRTYRAAKFPVGEALVMINLGRLAAEEGRFAEAHRHLDDARARLEDARRRELPDRGRCPSGPGVHPRGTARRRRRAGEHRARADALRPVSSACARRCSSGCSGSLPFRPGRPRRPRRTSRRACGSRGRSGPSTSSDGPCTRR